MNYPEKSTYNYHTHTFRCMHATGTEEEYINAAIKSGIKKLGFSDHIPCPFKGDFVSNMRMKTEEAFEYASIIRGLAKQYQKDIQIYLGFEAEYIPEFYTEQMSLLTQLDCDYLIMGQHNWQTEENKIYASTPCEKEERIVSYVDSIIEGMKTGNFSYLAHPDIIHFIGEENIYKREMLRLCQTLKVLNIPLEINLLGIRTNRHYPCERFFSIAGEVGNDIVIGIDAHDSDCICETKSYKKAIRLIKKYHLNLLADLTLKKPKL